MSPPIRIVILGAGWSSGCYAGRTFYEQRLYPHRSGETHNQKQGEASTEQGTSFLNGLPAFTMKRYGDLYRQITSYDNLLLAHLNARKGKTGAAEVHAVDKNLQQSLTQIQHLLLSKQFTTSPYERFLIHEPKLREISKLPYFPDRIVQHAVMNVLGPLWDKVFISDVYSAIPGRGIHAGLNRMKRFLKNERGTRYCLQFDIHQFYPSVDHDILMHLIERKIKCPDTLWLLENIVRSTESEEGIPIGNYLSQYFANIYLNSFDHWLKEVLKIRYYIRYADDGVILDGNKQRLNAIHKAIALYFKKKLRLSLNPKTQIYPVDVRGIDFLGYRTFRKYTLLRKRSVRSFKSKLSTIKQHWPELPPEHVVSTVMARAGWIKHCNGYNLTRKYLFNDRKIMTIMNEASAALGFQNPLGKCLRRLES